MKLFCCMVIGMALCYSSTACAKRALDRPDYVQIRHAGDEDHPIFTMVLLTDETPVSGQSRLIHRFVVSKKFFEAVARHVKDVKDKYSRTLKEPPRRGTFEVTWKAFNGSGRYFVLFPDSCSYMHELAKSAVEAVEGEKAARSVLQDLGQTSAYVGCKSDAVVR